ncbi:MAG: hypothetical protein ABMA13_17615 [Chthoniobacteraceae bacterium]
MKDILQNRLNMIDACIKLADREEFAPLLSGSALELPADLDILRGLYAAANETAILAKAATTGITTAKDGTETILEDRAHPLARACVNHFSKTHDMENCAKVNFSKSALQGLRDRDLVDTTKVIRDCAQIAVAHADAAKRGITAAKITALTAAITDFETLINAPRTRIADRAALLRELTTRVGACMTQIEPMDDIALQYAGTELGDRFAAAWKQTREIVDAGHGPGEEPAPTPPNP